MVIFTYFELWTETPIIIMLMKNGLLFIRNKQLPSRISFNHCTNLCPQMAPANPKSQYFVTFHLSLRSTAHRCVSRQCRATYSPICTSKAWKSVLASMSYLNASLQISWLRPRQSRVDSGMVPPNSLKSWMILSRSVTDPFAARSRISVIKTTILWEVGSSKQYLNMQGPGRLFSAQAPSKTYWMMSLSEPRGPTSRAASKTMVAIDATKMCVRIEIINHAMRISQEWMVQK